MKILYVEGNETHRKLTTRKLIRLSHSVDLYLPEQSVYGSSQNEIDPSQNKIPTFQDEQGLVKLLIDQQYDLALLDCETFRSVGRDPLNVIPEYFADSYIQAILKSTYQGQLLITTTLPKEYLRTKSRLPEEIPIFEKAVSGLVELTQILEELSLSKKQQK